jgi:hypothetical protein
VAWALLRRLSSRSAREHSTAPLVVERKCRVEGGVRATVLLGGAGGAAGAALTTVSCWGARVVQRMVQQSMRARVKSASACGHTRTARWSDAISDVGCKSDAELPTGSPPTCWSEPPGADDSRLRVYNSSAV